MKYPPIEIRIEDEKYIEFYFKELGKPEQWFYEIHDIRNETQLKEWDEHLSYKNWYTPEIRKETINLMREIISKQDYLKSQGLETVDVGSRLALIKQIQKIQKDRGKSTKGFEKMPKKQLVAIYHKIS